MLAFKNFKKRYYNFLAIDIPDFEINKGIYRLVGENGSGKSTLLKAMAGLLTYTGDLALDGITLNNAPLTQRQMVNYSEADPKFPPFLTGSDFLKLFALTKGSTKSHVEQIINQLDIKSFIDDPIGTYSSGMLKKLSVSLAFLGKPRVILLDEPFANVDNNSLESIYTLINEYQVQQKSIFLIVSHQDLIPDSIIFDGEITVANKKISWS